jgi:hypothetical protein
MAFYKYREEVRGLRTLETVKSDLAKASNPRAKAFEFLAYARLTEEVRLYLQQYVR